MSGIPQGGAFQRALPDDVGLGTLGVRGGLMRTGFEETSEALFLNSGFVYESAEAAEQAFTGEVDHFVYSATATRRSRCSKSACVSSKVQKRALRRPAECRQSSRRWAHCWPTATDWLPRAASSDPASWCATRSFRAGGSRLFSSTARTTRSGKRRCPVPTTAVFLETPSNPMQSLVDVRRVSELAHAAGAKVVLDNVFATPLHTGAASIWVPTSLCTPAPSTIDGQGRVLGGAILGTEEYISGPVRELMRPHRTCPQPVQKRVDTAQGPRDHAGPHSALRGFGPRGSPNSSKGTPASSGSSIRT